MVTDEATELYEHENLVLGSGFAHEDLQNITEDNLDKLLASIKPIDEHQVVVGGVTIGTAAALWPFVMAYLKRRIARDQLEQVFEHVLGKAGVSLASRLAYATVFRPLFAWYLLARGVKGIVELAEPENCVYMEFRPRSLHIQHA